jgi:hypothetical protein
VFRRFGDPDPELRGADAAALHAIPFKGGAERKSLQGLCDGRSIGARIGERSGEHVSRKPGKCVYVADIHGYFSLGDRPPMYTRQGKSESQITQAGGLCFCNQSVRPALIQENFQ